MYARRSKIQTKLTQIFDLHRSSDQNSSINHTIHSYNIFFCNCVSVMDPEIRSRSKKTEKTRPGAKNARFSGTALFCSGNSFEFRQHFCRSVSFPFTNDCECALDNAHYNISRAVSFRHLSTCPAPISAHMVGSEYVLWNMLCSVFVPSFGLSRLTNDMYTSMSNLARHRCHNGIGGSGRTRRVSRHYRLRTDQRGRVGGFQSHGVRLWCGWMSIDHGRLGRQDLGQCKWSISVLLYSWRNL